MLILPVKWAFERDFISGVVNVKGETMIKDSEIFVIDNALDIIENAKQFKGKLYPKEPIFCCTSEVTVSFSLIFPSENDINKYFAFLRENH